MYDAGGTIAQRLVAKYSLAAIPRDPATMMIASVGLGVAGAGISAIGTLGSGDAAAQAGEMSAAATRNAGAITAAAQESGGALAQKAAEYRAEQLDQNATTTRAQSQRQAFDLNQQTRLALSTLRARSAGSGLASSGSTPVEISSQIGSRGAYLSLTAMANGENTARGLEDAAFGERFSGAAAKYGGELAAYGTRAGSEAQAQADVFKGNAQQDASQWAAAGTLASGAGSAFGNYAKFAYPTTSGRAGV